MHLYDFSPEMQSCIGYIYVIFPCEFSHGSLSCLKLQMQRWFSPISKILSCLISAPDVVQHSYEVFWLDPQVLLFWGFSVRQHILPNQWHFNYLSCLDRCSHIVYILRFFSRMSFQMCPKIARMNRCKVALATFMLFSPVWVFSWFLKLLEVTDATLHLFIRAILGHIWKLILEKNRKM